MYFEYQIVVNTIFSYWLAGLDMAGYSSKMTEDRSFKIRYFTFNAKSKIIFGTKFYIFVSEVFICCCQLQIKVDTLWLTHYLGGFCCLCHGFSSRQGFLGLYTSWRLSLWRVHPEIGHVERGRGDWTRHGCTSCL